MLTFISTPHINTRSFQSKSLSRYGTRKLVLRRPRPRCQKATVACSLFSDPGAVYGTDVSSALTDDLRREFKRYPIQLMACDMDGTMLNRSIQIPLQNIAAVKRLLSETEVLFVPATGKSRSGALRSMGGLGQHLQDMYPNGCPGVFLQGLIVFGVTGEVVYENTCDSSLSRSVVQLSNELNLDLIAYSRDSILCESRSEFVDLLPTYHEPVPEEIGNWETAIGARPLNKFIFMADPARIDAIRPLVAQGIGNTGVLTQAQGNMLEVLPPNSSKGNGVKLLLEDVAIAPDNVLAIGDAENDLEMLSMVRYSCAVENALPSVRAVARYTDIRSNDDSGVAHAIERFILNTSEARA